MIENIVIITATTKGENLARRPCQKKLNAKHCRESRPQNGFGSKRQNDTHSVVTIV